VVPIRINLFYNLQYLLFLRNLKQKMPENLQYYFFSVKLIWKCLLCKELYVFLTFRSEIQMTLLNSIFSSRHESFHSYDDDHDLGEIGGDADVACDFGGDFGGF
jgi:hypothetical protein